MTGAHRAQLAQAIQQDRCIRSLNYLREYLVPSVAQYYLKKGWMTPTIASSTIRTRLPRPTKRTKLSADSAASAFLETAGYQPQTDAVMEDFHPNAYTSDTESTEEELEGTTKDAETTH
ncbi:MAG: hypothetical protein EXX96DRAFT_96349 [Benjaminiella poitrasii]|nr:MAG: hypothetical protein EXX96DRAFT_96349 [Benjaminiella poitrasii]